MDSASTEVQISLTADEALVLFELLWRFSDTNTLAIVDQAEQRALWNLQCVLEKQLIAPFNTDYSELLRCARERLRDEG
jgi:hypothetical protein